MPGEENKLRQTYNINRLINQKTFVSSIISAQNAESLDQTKMTGIIDQSKLSLTARLDTSIVIKDQASQKFSIKDIMQKQAQYVSKINLK